MARPRTVGNIILESAQFHKTVADIAKTTGAKPNTIRAVLRNAALKGSIHIKRFYKGKSARAIEVVCHNDKEHAERINSLVCMWCGKENV